MNLCSIAWNSVRQRWLASALTALSVALGIMLMVTVLVVHGIVKRNLELNAIGYDLVVGPKGSDLELVLSSVYRMRPPIENVPYLYYLELKNHKWVETAIPVVLGDTSDKGNFPIVGTTREYFTNDYEPDKKFLIRWKKGYRGFKGSLDAIIGAEVAKKNDWDIGAQFQLIHSGADAHKHEEKFTVIGVMERTHTPNDRTVFITLEGFYGIADHGKSLVETTKRLKDFFGGKYTDEEIDQLLRTNPDARKEVTAIFITVGRRPNNPRWSPSKLAFSLAEEINKGYRAQAVNPIIVIKRLMDQIVGNVRNVMVVFVALIIGISGVSIFVSIYNSMSDRKKEIAIMRALGARRRTVFSIILTESILLCLGGGVLGMLMGHGLVFAAGPYIAEKYSLSVDAFAFEPLELVLFPLLIVLASLVGFVPGMTAYRTDVAETLGD